MTYVRMTTLWADPSKVEEGIRFVREQALAIARQQPGFEGMRLLVNRSSGKAIGVTLWASEAAAQAAESALNQVRTESAQVSGAASSTTEVFEMVINESVLATPA
jgi:heme-degrading monooxygenase HmoA